MYLEISSPLEQPSEPPEIARAVNWAAALSLPLRRPSPHHVKLGRLNYWPVKGTLQFDGERSRSERGFEAFKRLAMSLKDL